MALCEDDFTSSIKRVRKVAKSNGIKVQNNWRKELCVTGVDLCVLKDEDILFILSGAETQSAAERRLRTCIANAPYAGKV